MSVKMKIAIEGCAHGELEEIYGVVEGISRMEGKIDLLICCGDFQATRNLTDLQTMAVPKKYREMGSFYKYYTGELVAPLLTIFVGGNHEASNYLQELPYGGWVAPNIYYMGYAGVVNVNGFRIGGISGICKGFDYLRGRFEFPPYDGSTVRSVYHVRHFDVFRLSQLTGDIDIFISHDWPRGIYNYGNRMQLINFKPYFKADIESGKLGGRPLQELLHTLKPKYWFAAHLHCKFAALVPHDTDGDKTKTEAEGEGKSGEKPETVKKNVTKFLALDKCISNRRFLQVLNLEREATDSEKEAKVAGNNEICFKYDEQWLAIVANTNHLISIREGINYMPSANSTINERCKFTPTPEELQQIRIKFGNLKIPKNFCRIVKGYQPHEDNLRLNYDQPSPMINPQTVQFCNKLYVDDPMCMLLMTKNIEINYAKPLEEPPKRVLTTTAAAVQLDLQEFLDFGKIDESNPLKRKALKMPEVSGGKSASEPIPANEIDEANEKIPEEKSTTLTEGEVPPSGNDDELVETVSSVSICGEVNKEKDGPTPTKFMRRNANIYTEEGDDSSSPQQNSLF